MKSYRNFNLKKNVPRPLCNKAFEAGAVQHGLRLFECIDYPPWNQIHLPITPEVGRGGKCSYFGINM